MFRQYNVMIQIPDMVKNHFFSIDLKKNFDRKRETNHDENVRTQVNSIDQLTLTQIIRTYTDITQVPNYQSLQQHIEELIFLL